MTKQRFRFLFGVVACACIVGVYVAAMADTLRTYEVGAVTKFNATFVGSGGTTQYMDSTKRIAGYPIGVDTTGNGTYCHWIGSSRKLFGFLPDSTDVYKFYETVGPDTAIVGMDSVLCWSTTGGAPERFIYDTRALGDTVISTAKIKLLAVTSGRIAAFVAGDSLKFGTGVITSRSLADGQVKAADIQNLTITSGKLAAGAVADSTKIATGAVTSAKIVDGQVKTADLENFGVTAAKLAAGSVDSTCLKTDAAGRVGINTVESDTTVSSVIKGLDGSGYVQFMGIGPSGNYINPMPIKTTYVRFPSDSLGAVVSHTAWIWSNGDSTVLGNAGGSARVVLWGDSVIVHGLYRLTH